MLSLHLNLITYHRYKELDSSGPIGIFDSGVGGLSVLRAIRTILPTESLLYLADSRYAPYGDRSDTFISSRSIAITDWLVNEGAKAIVIACNTATVQTIDYLRAHLLTPVIGLEPSLKPAITLSKTGKIGILATAATLRSRRFLNLLERFRHFCQFTCVPGIGLVEIIESGITHGSILEKRLSACLMPMKKADVDTIVLGCTHYLFIRNAIQAQIKKDVKLIDTNNTIAKQVNRCLIDANLIAPSGASTNIRLASTNNGVTLAQMASDFLEFNSPIEHVDIPCINS